jgi:hypothetical protein
MLNAYCFQDPSYSSFSWNWLISPNIVNRRKNFQSIKYVRCYVYNMISKWISDALWIKGEQKKKTNSESWVEVQKRKCQIHIQELRLVTLGWTHGLCIRVNENASSFSYQVCVLSLAIHCQATVLPDFSDEFLHPLHLLPLHLHSPSPPYNLLSISSNGKYLLVKVTKNFIIVISCDLL